MRQSHLPFYFLHLEDKLAAIENDISANASNYGKLTELSTVKEALEVQLMEKMERWEYLEDLAEQIKAQR